MQGNVRDSFLSALLGEDELGVVVRAHIYVESVLNQYLDESTSSPHHLPRLRYEQRVNLACALGLSEDLAPALKALGNIRNSFGHRIDTRLTPQMTSELFNSLPPRHQKTGIAAYQQAQGDSDIAFSTLPTKNQFVVAAMVLKELVQEATLHVRNRKAAT